ncbi:MAG: sodium:solute symporter [Paludibacteraceae bacterium]|nr:sodium:solute symporter [Paludibacteraceae bacterium]
MLWLLLFYVLLLFSVSFGVGRNLTASDFYLGSRRSPWYVVAFGMIGASISGVTFVSVPGWVESTGFTYIQMCIGFFFGYCVVAYLLLPLYYRMNLTSIYGYLEARFGLSARRTGAIFFLVSKLTGSAAKLYVAVLVLHRLLFEEWGISFSMSLVGVVAIIWLYSYRGGIRTIVWTDFVQTFFLLLALSLLLVNVVGLLDVDFSSALSLVGESDYSRLFVWDDWVSPRHFFKQFLSGIFVVIVMTGLDQDLMQKNLSCKDLRSSRKNMLVYGAAFIPVNLLFLSLGVLVITFFRQTGVEVPPSGDELLPAFVRYAGPWALGCFLIGMLASAFSSADSALTSLTTSTIVDVAGWENKKGVFARRSRLVFHLLFSLLLILFALAFYSFKESSAINLIYTLVSYLYGPLLGMFAFGLFTKWNVRQSYVPFVAVAAPLLTYAVDGWLNATFSYKMGYEMLLLNGGWMFVGLLLIRSGATSGLPDTKGSC